MCLLEKMNQGKITLKKLATDVNSDNGRVKRSILGCNKVYRLITELIIQLLQLLDSSINEMGVPYTLSINKFHISI